MSLFSKEIAKDKKIYNPRSKTRDFNFWNRIDMDQIKKTHEEMEITKVKGLKAALGGLDLNPIQLSGREMHQEDRRLNKFKYVFQKFKQGMGIGEKEIRHRDRTKVVKQVYYTTQDK